MEKGPWVQRKAWIKTLHNRNLKNDPFWLYFVPALLSFTTELFEVGLFNPYKAWHYETSRNLVQRELRRTQAGIYSLSGFEAFLSGRESKDVVNVQFLAGGYYPFIRILQCLHISCDSIYERPELDEFKITAEQKCRFQQKRPIYVNFGLGILPVEQRGGFVSADGKPIPHKRARLDERGRVSLEIKPLLGAKKDTTNMVGKDPGNDQIPSYVGTKNDN